MTSLGDFKELCYIDCNLATLEDLKIPGDVNYLNLHCNRFVGLSSLQHLTPLTFLDVSSNHISSLLGLDCLLNLKVLNLSCNKIKDLDGVQPLRKLVTLNASYNEIVNLFALKSFQDGTHLLMHLDLHGNKISSIGHLIDSLVNCTSLKQLCLQSDTDDNPVCHLSSYRSNVIAQLPQLELLDNLNKNGIAPSDENLQNIKLLPGFEGLINFVCPTETSSSAALEVTQQSSASSLHQTPVIDKVIQTYKQNKKGRLSTRQSNCDDTEDHAEVPTSDINVANRLFLLENQISNLLQVYGSDRKKRHSKSEEEDTLLDVEPTQDIVWSNETESSDPDMPAPSIKLQTAKEVQVSKARDRKSSKTGKVSASSKSVHGYLPGSNMRQVTSAKDDEAQLMLMQEIELERTRRWKAEQAARRLTDNIKEIQEKLTEERYVYESMLAANNKLKQALAVERDAKQNAEKREDELKIKLENLQSDFGKAQKSVGDYRGIVSALEENIAKVEKEKLTSSSHQMKQLNYHQSRASAATREVELLRVAEKQLKGHLQQMQELLATREQDHKIQLENMVAVGSKEFIQATEKELSKQERRFHQSQRQMEERLESQKRDYIELENEFRAALHIEANRFGELQEEYQKVAQERDFLRNSLDVVTTKKDKESSLIAELTSMVKEQKIRLEEITKSRHEVCSQYKDRIAALELECSQLRKQSQHVNSLEQDKSKLGAQIRAQDSVIEGLRAERKLWGMELAKQGSSLALDRGRLESMVERLTKEVAQLHKTEKEDAESIAIKQKLIEDQTDSIGKLKETSAKQSEQIKSAQIKFDEIVETLERNVQHQNQESEKLQHDVEDLTQQKRALKTEARSLKLQLDKESEEMRLLKRKWAERSDLIDQLENKVLKMKQNFDSKEAKLQEQKEIALTDLRKAKDELQTCQGDLAKQLDTQKKNYDLQMRKIIAAKDDEIAKHKQEVSNVEEEMRLILAESQQTKQTLQGKIKLLTSSFKEIQQDLDI